MTHRNLSISAEATNPRPLIGLIISGRGLESGAATADDSNTKTEGNSQRKQTAKS